MFYDPNEKYNDWCYKDKQKIINHLTDTRFFH